MGGAGTTADSGAVPTPEELEQLAAVAESAIAAAADRAAWESLRVEWAGARQGRLRELQALIPRAADKRAYGQAFNRLKQRVEAALEARDRALAVAEEAARSAGARVDVTLPGRRPLTGSLHPVTLVTLEIYEIFRALGYSVAEGPEVEDDRLNFALLNFPDDHPARDAQDTLFTADGRLLRTHTSPVQIRTMLARQPPIRVICPGRVFRNDNDLRHSPMFHQVEALCVGEGVTYGDLKGTLEAFLRRLFAPGTGVRLRPSYFPFTEPSCEVDITCQLCAGAGCPTCSGTGWMEILGAGMVDPRVLDNCGIDPDRYSGFALGMGLDRVAMNKWAIPNIRSLFESDERLLRQVRGDDMQFLLSWLADHVDLVSTLGLPLEADASGRHRLTRLSDEDKEKTFQLGKTLTAVGLAVEGLEERPPTDGAPDFVLDVDVTSNRPDCMNHIGLARELAVALGTTLREGSFPSTESLSSWSDVSEQKASPSLATTTGVVIEDPEACPRFTARTIRGVKLGPSPEWLRRRLEGIGLRSINNVVDATNYVLWETGQPLHAYDLATVPGGELRVRRARAGETLVTLDGKSRALDPEVLVIADRERPVGLAGIMGGLATEVTERTVDVLLEAAHFDRRRVRIGAKRLGLHTDASHRFERGADVGACDFASRRCAELIVELAGGAIDPDAVDALGTLPEPVRWRLEPAALARFAGLEVPELEIARILDGLGFAPARGADGAFVGTVPTWRAVDFEPRRRPRAGGPDREAWAQDLFEEVLRQHGLDRLPSTLPRLSGVDEGRSPGFELRLRIARCLAGLGFAEAIHYAFQDRAADERLPALVDGPPIELANPLSDRYAVLRRSLVPNLVAAAEFNFRHGADGVRLFELGGLFPGAGEEVAAVAVVASGGAGAPWDRRPAIDLHELAGVFEALLLDLGVVAEAEPAELPGVVSGTGGCWRAGGEVLGWFGTIAVADAPQPVHAGELRLDRLADPVAARPVVAPPRLPGISADLTLVHALERSWREIERAVAEARVEHLVGFRLKDRYQGSGVPAGAVATTMTFDYHAGERTLTQEEVNERHGALAVDLERRFGLAREGPR